MAKILVVDDEKIIVKGIRFSLLQDQMEEDCAYDGEQAVEMARNTEYDVVLLDVMLPKLDGFQVCQAIREFSNMPDKDVILPAVHRHQDYKLRRTDKQQSSRLLLVLFHVNWIQANALSVLLPAKFVILVSMYCRQDHVFIRQ